MRTTATMKWLCGWIAWCVILTLPAASLGQTAAHDKVFRIGIIGLDTSHATAFTKEFNKDQPVDALKGMRVVAAYPKGSPDIESSVSRVPGYTEQVKKMGVKIVDSIDQLLGQVDGVLLETNDGRPHLEQALPVLRAHKPVFVDKPTAGSLGDVVAIFLAADKFQTPIFSSSSLRYVSGAQKARAGTVGDIIGCDAFSPCPLEPTHPDLYWYGIHGVETLFTVMKTGCESVRRVSTPETDVVVGVWPQGRIGTFRGLRAGTHSYGGRAFGTKGILDVGDYEEYLPLIVQIAEFFRTGQPPVPQKETLEIYAFMTAADVSKQQDGAPVKLSTVLQQAHAQAIERLQALGVDVPPK